MSLISASNSVAQLLIRQHDLPGKQIGHPVTVRPHGR
jgi:hypothetical protein